MILILLYIKKYSLSYCKLQYQVYSIELSNKKKKTKYKEQKKFASRIAYNGQRNRKRIKYFFELGRSKNKYG